MTQWLAGGYTADMGGTAEGISLLSENADGTLQLDRTAAMTDSPSYLAVAGDVVVAVAEKAGAVATFRLQDGALTPLGRESVDGAATCHVAVYDGTIVTASYGSGTVSAQPLLADGTPGPLAQRIEAEGSGPHEARDGPHEHSTFRVDDGTVLSADLGTDSVYLHSFRDGALERTARLGFPGGTGPRDIEAAPGGGVLVLGELSGELFLLDWDGASLEFRSSARSAGHQEGDHDAAIAVSADGRFAFTAQRGSNRVSVFRIEDGALTALRSVPSGGEWPRHLAVAGDRLHVSNERSHGVATFAIGADGSLDLLSVTEVPSPTHLVRVTGS